VFAWAPLGQAFSSFRAMIAPSGMPPPMGFAVAVAELAEPFEEALGRHVVAALALDGLDEDRGHVLGRRRPLEEYVLDEV
jgi:hypothetical protein